MWLVLYGHGRGLRSSEGGGGISAVKHFKDEQSAKEFVQKCQKSGLRTTEPAEIGTANVARIE
jgi:hypothetical protein